MILVRYDTCWYDYIYKIKRVKCLIFYNYKLIYLCSAEETGWRGFNVSYSRYSNQSTFKGAVSVISSKRLEDIHVFLTRNVFIHCFLLARNAQVTLKETPKWKKKQFNKQKHEYLIHTWYDKAFKGIACCKFGIVVLQLRLQSLL